MAELGAAKGGNATGSDAGKALELAGRADVGKVAEKVVKNVSCAESACLACGKVDSAKGEEG